MFARAAGIQAIAIAAFFVLLLALPLPEDFFRDWGALTGPAAWLLCAALTARLLRLPPRKALLAAAGSGVLAALVGVLLNHTLGLVVGIVCFGALCAAEGIPGSRPAGAEPRRRAA